MPLLLLLLLKKKRERIFGLFIHRAVPLRILSNFISPTIREFPVRPLILYYLSLKKENARAQGVKGFIRYSSKTQVR